MDVLTLEEAARYVRVSEKTLREMAKSGRIPSQRAGREWRFLRRALEDWLTGSNNSSLHADRISETNDSQYSLNLFDNQDTKEAGFSDTAFTKNREEPVHNWVPWVAGFSAAFVGEILNRELEKKTDLTVLDPFAGVGTTLLEGVKRGCNVVGFEINPYACLVCKAKIDALHYDHEAIVEIADRLYMFARKRSQNGNEPISRPPHGFRTRDRFLSPRVERQALFMKDFIIAEKEEWAKQLLNIAFGSVLVGISNYTYEPSLGRRVAVGKTEILDVDLPALMRDKLLCMAGDVKALQKNAFSHKNGSSACVFKESYLDSGVERLGKGSVDVLITSPPYMNNYHYVRNTRPQLYWLDLVENSSDLQILEKSSFGKYWQTVRGDAKISLDFLYPDLEGKLKELRLLHSERGAYGGPGWANYAATYFNDCARFLQVTAQVMNPNGLVVIVIGNNILQGIEFKTETFLASLAQNAGFHVVGIHKVRKKRTGSSIINSDVRVAVAKAKTELYEVAIELRASSGSK